MNSDGGNYSIREVTESNRRGGQTIPEDSSVGVDCGEEDLIESGGKRYERRKL